MKHQIGDCFKRMEEVTEGWNEYNLTKTIMIVDVIRNPIGDYYKALSDFKYDDTTSSHFPIVISETEIDKFFYRLHTREEILEMLNHLNDLP